MPDDLERRVVTSIAEAQRIPVEKVTLDSTFEELGIDSMDAVNILFALETEFDIHIPDDAAMKIRSVRDAVEGVAALVQARQPAPE